MSAGASAGAAHAAAAAHSRAVKASGVIVKVTPDAFLNLLERHAEPLVIHATGGIFSISYRYLSSYKGLAFFTQSPVALSLPSKCEVIQAQKIWVPE